MGNEKGFTLIELIMVIVILGILAAVAIPRYQDLRTEAQRAAADGVFGAAQGATAVNFAARLVSPTRATAITNGASLAAAMDQLPTGWTITGNSINTTTTPVYTIGVAQGETPTGGTAPTQRARLAKSWTP